MKYLNVKMNWIIYIGFILIIPIGTITHELGHYLPAKYLGHNPIFHYDKVSVQTTNKQKKISKIVKKNKYELEENIPFKEKELYLKLLNELSVENNKILLGGMFSTYILGTLGLLIILINKSIFKRDNIINIIGLFLSFFWLRPIFNLGYSLSKYVFGISSYPFLGDELMASIAFGCNIGTLPILMAIIGLIIIITTSILIIPRNIYPKFVFWALLGVMSGYLIWFRLLGPIILP